MAPFRIIILVALLPMVQCFNFIKLEEYTSADCDPGNMTYMDVPADNYASDRYGTQAAKGWYTFNGEFPGYTTSLIGVNYLAQDVCMKILRHSDIYYKFTCTDTDWTKSSYSDKDCQGEPTRVDSKPLGCTITDEEWSKNGDFISYSKATCNNWIPAIRWTSYKAADCSGEVESSNLDVVYPFGPCMPMGGDRYDRGATSDKRNGQIHRRRYGSGHGARRRRRAGRFVTYDTLMFTSVDSHTLTERTESDYDIHGDRDEQELSGSLNCDAPDDQENVEETTKTCGECTSHSSWSEYVMIRGEDNNGGWTDGCGQDANPGGYLQNLGVNGCSPGSECGVCQGDCDADGDCRTGLKCFQRSTSEEVVPGCAAGGSGDLPGHDYCYEAPTEAPTTTTTTTTQFPCEGWCADNENSWSTKCSWQRSCKGCQKCQDHCKPSCKNGGNAESYPWSTKCSWKTCRLCTQCNKCRPFCKPADDTDEAWEPKCQKAKCKDCERCKNLAEKAAMSSQGGLRRLEEASSASLSLNALLV